MIDGAKQILGGIPAVHLNPFSLAEAQRAETPGYVLVCYVPEYSPPFCDLFLFKGPTVYEYVTFDEERRKRIDAATARKHFADDLHPHTTLIYLFLAEEAVTTRFLSAACLEPTMKIGVDGLKKRQIQTLLQSALSGRMLAERNDFTTAPPSFEFREIDPAAPTLDFRLGFRHGKFLLYDITTSLCIRSADAPTPPTATSSGLPIPSPEPPRGLRIQTSGELSLFPEECPVDTIDAPPRKVLPERTRPARAEGNEVTDATLGAICSDSGVIVLFHRLLRSFRKQAADCLGSKARQIFTASERHMQTVSPQFSLSTLEPETAPLVLDFINDVIKKTPRWKRKKVRNAALDLLGDLYAKHYDEIAQSGNSERLEEMYYRLKE